MISNREFYKHLLFGDLILNNCIEIMSILSQKHLEV